MLEIKILHEPGRGNSSKRDLLHCQQWWETIAQPTMPGDMPKGSTSPKQATTVVCAHTKLGHETSPTLFSPEALD